MRRFDAHPKQAAASFVEILRERADRLSDKPVFAFLTEAGTGAEAGSGVTFADLDRRARALATRLQRLGLAGERALLLYPPGLEFITAFFGCLYAGVVAVPANLPRPNRPMPRLRAIVSDARPLAVLTTGGLLPDSVRWIAEAPGLDGLHRIATDDVDPALADRWKPTRTGPDDTAFLQYTSGSTATPKGVMISHGNLIANSSQIRACFGSSEESRGVFWLPLFHDMGLIGGVLQTIDCGGSSLLMSPVTFLQRPRLWLEAIGRSGATISGGPDFAYDLCVRKIGPGQREGLDLSRWTVAFNGAEPIRVETLDRFAESFAPCGFRREAFLPCYGLAESTLLVSGRRSGSGPVAFTASASALGQDRVEPTSGTGAESRSIAGSGGVPETGEVAIVDPATRTRCGEGRVGEIWVRGPSVARGYWGRDEETAETFRAVLADGEGPFLRTGDVGFLRQGELFVTGRLKDLIIIRGRNVYPQDVEWTVSASHPALRPGGAAAFAVEIEGRERLVVVSEVERLGKGPSAQDIIASVRRSVSEGHELEVHAVCLIKLMALPRTSSGKVQRHLCREAFLSDSLALVGSWTKPAEGETPGAIADADANGQIVAGQDAGDLASWLIARVSAVLRVPASEIDPHRPITGYGLDSLSAMELKAAVEADLGVELPLTTLLDGPTIASLAEALRGLARRDEQPAAIDSGTCAEGALSVGQQSLWYAHQLSPNPGAYNIAGAARIRGDVDVDAFRRALQRLVDRHEALRTTFPVVEGRPVLKVHDRMDAHLLAVDTSCWSDEARERARHEEARRPFDLEAGPLHRVFLWSMAPRQHVVLLVIHHIIGDFWTTAVVLDEFAAIYTDERSGAERVLNPLSLRYSDFVRWQANRLAGPAGGRLAAYWKKRLAGPLPDLELPTDRPRPAIRGQSGSSRGMELDEGLTRALADLAESRGTSLYVALLAALQVLLSRYGGQDDVIVGSPVAGRTRQGLEGLVGYFVNLVPMRADLSGDPTFEAFLARVRTVVHEGLEHQDYPFGRMVEDLEQAADPSRTPIFSVMFIYQKAQRLADAGLTPFALASPGHAMDLGGLPLESLSLDRNAALFDLTLMAAIGDGRLSFAMEFSADLFDPETVDRLLGHYRVLLRGIVADPAQRIAALPILSGPERLGILGEWAATATARDPSARAIHRLFEAHARRTPEAVAVIAGEDRATYRDLDERANRIADRLRRLGVGPGRLVGLCCERSAGLIAGLLGILKAGGAYVPLDPAHPRERLAFVLEDARAPVVVVDDRTRAVLGDIDAAIVEIDRRGDDRSTWPGQTKDGAIPSAPASPGDPAYVVYTSGSTGAPKGVMVSHGSLMAAYSAWESAYGLRTGARHLQMAGVAFDVFTGDWTRALCSGGTLVLCPRDVLLDPEALVDLMDRERIAIAEFVPAVVEGVVGCLERSSRSLPHLHLIAVGSDLWHVGLYERLRRAVEGRARVVNSYGLTETAVDSTYFEGPLHGVSADRPVPIGRPFAGARAYVLDRAFQPLPAGVAGELFLGGPGVALGYWRRPSLTAERFVPDPFGGEPGSRLFRTGDTARWRPDGTLELLGRGDRQVKIRGYRIELGEIESALLRHPGVREAAVVVRDEGERRLAAYFVADGGPAPDAVELRRWLKDGLPDYMVPASFTALDRLPLSANGKVDRKALAAIAPMMSDREATHVAPRNAVEETLARIVAGALGVEAVGIEDDLFTIGVDSILIIQIVSRARQAGLRLDPVQVFRRPTIAGLAEGLGLPEEDPPRPDPVPVDLLDGFDRERLVRALGDAGGVEDAYPLSPVQEGMLFHTLLEPEAGAYVEQFHCRLLGDLDDDAFVDSWRRLVERHAALRTSIPRVDSGRPIQAVHDRADLPVDRRDWRGVSRQEQDGDFGELLRADRTRGFVLAVAPLMRLSLIRLRDDLHAMVWTSHHLVLDGWCLPILLGEVLALYEAAVQGRAATLPTPRPFRDYLAWLHRQDPSRSEAYWRRSLAGFAAPTPIGVEPPGPRDRAASPPFAEHEAWMGERETADLRSAARSLRVTLGTLVQGAWALLLSRYGGQADVVFGVTVSGRPADLDGVETIVGVLINTLPLRVEVDEEAAVGPWLAGIQARTAEMRRFESTPLVKVQEWSDVPRGRPLFESIVIVQNTPVADDLAGRAGRIGIRDARMEERTSYPLALTVVPGGRLHLRIGHDGRRFSGAAIERMIGHLRAILNAIADGPDGRLADLSMLTEVERASHRDRGPLVPLPVPSASQIDRLSAEEIDAYLMELRGSMEGRLA